MKGHASPLRSLWARVLLRLDSDRRLSNQFECRRLLQDGRLSIGWGTYGFPRVLDFGEAEKIAIGNYCSIAVGVEVFLGGNHRTDWISTFPFMEFPNHYPACADVTGHPSSDGDVVIGHDVWLGRGATVLSGVSVGNGAVVGARAVVSRDVPPYSVVVGNPGRVVKKRFPDAIVERLESLQWWLLPPSVIAGGSRLLLQEPTEARLDELESRLRPLRR